MKLSNSVCKEISEELSHFLSDSFVLYIKTLNYHWNMKGKQFYMYHRLLQEQYENLQNAVDDLAERIRMLGQLAPGSMTAFLELSCLKEGNSKKSQDEMIKELIKDHELMESHLHEMIEFVDEHLDQGTSDLLAERIRFHSKSSWILQSHF